MTTWIRRALVATAAVAASASIASAQAVQYSTNGTFSGGACTPPAGPTCTIVAGGGTATLTFNGEIGASYFAPVSGASLGQILLGATAGGPFNYNGVGFTLNIVQSQPSGGNATVVGQLTGTFTQTMFGATGGPLVLNLNSYNFSIGAANYMIQQTGPGGMGIAITLPGGTPTSNPEVTTIRANINVVPEPSTVLLLGSGIAGLGLFGIRSRRRQGAAA